MRRVILESPCAGSKEDGTWDRNIAYARACLLDSLSRGERPLASHLLYTQVLDDDDPEQRKLGIAAGLAWLGATDAIVVYTNLGTSTGMKEAVSWAGAYGVKVEYRTLNGDWS